MITRTWHGRTSIKNANAYLKLLKTKGTAEYKSTPGNLSVKIQQKMTETCCHFWTVTEWKDVESIRQFAGTLYEKAKYYPEDDKFLLKKEEFVLHTETHDLSRMRIQAYSDQLQRLYGGENWLDETYLSKLGIVDEQTAFKIPFPGAHSIAAIVWHCIYWRSVLIKRLEGHHNYRDETVADLNFLPIPELQKMGWKKLLNELDRTQKTLIKHMNSKDDEFLDSGFTTGYSFRYFIEGIIEHDAYHLGQIGLVYKMVGN